MKKILITFILSLTLLFCKTALCHQQCTSWKFDVDACITHYNNLHQDGNTICYLMIQDANTKGTKSNCPFCSDCLGHKEVPDPAPPPKPIPFITGGCTDACSINFKIQNQSPIALTSKVITCVKNTLSNLFNEKCENYILTPLKVFMKNIVFLALTLFVILFGIKIVLKGEIDKKGIFAFLLKFGVVLYLCIGDGLNFVYEATMAFVTTLPNYVTAAGNNIICQYKVEKYPSADYAYLLTWDILDCRLIHYLGIGIIDTSATALSILGFGTLAPIIPLIFSLNIIPAILFLVYGIFVLSLVVSFVYTVILAMLGIAILIYLGLLFVPMILFDYTKPLFDSWWKALLSCALQPAVIATVIAFVFMVFDSLIYEGCDHLDSVYFMNNRDNPMIQIVPKIPTQGADPTPELCKKTLAYQFSNFPSSSEPANNFLFSYAQIYLSWDQALTLIIVLMKTIIFCYLFMIIAENCGELAAKLTSGPDFSKFGMKANDIINSVMSSVQGNSGGGGDKGGGGKGGGKSTTPKVPRKPG